MKKWLLPFVFLAASLAAQVDVAINKVGPYLDLTRGASWGISGLGGIQNNYIFTPSTPEQGVCVYVTNNNPTNSHSINFTVSQTGDPTNGYRFQNIIPNRWLTLPANQVLPLTIAANGTAGVFYRTTAAAFIAVTITGTSTAAGNPDTADMYVVYTSQTLCGIAQGNPLPVQGLTAVGNGSVAILPANQFPVPIGGIDSSNLLTELGFGTNGFSNPKGILTQPGSGLTNLFIKSSNNYNAVYGANGAAGVGFVTIPQRLSGASSIVPGMIVDELRAHTHFNQAYYTSTSTSAPGANSTLLHIFCSSCSTQITPVRLRVGCQATTPTNCDVEVVRTSAIGTTCSTPTINDMFVGNSGTPAATLQNGCTGTPTVVANSTIVKEFISSNATDVIDLTGFMIQSSTPQGILIRNPTAITTGIMNVSIEWAEE